MNDYPINYHVLSDFNAKDYVFTQEDGQWLLESLHTMCNAYDALMEAEEGDTYAGTLEATVTVALDVTDEPVETYHDLARLILQVADSPLENKRVFQDRPVAERNQRHLKEG